MNYVFQFGDVWAARGDLLWGAWLTIQLSASAMVLGLLVAVVCALGKTMGELHRWINTLIYFIKNNGELDAIHRKWLNAPLPELPVF